MEKAFYPRNDTVNAVVSSLLPRDMNEDILPDQHGDPVYLQRSSILDGVNIKGFGYTNGKPYKWNLEIETAVKSIAMVPDRFYSIYGKSYPIKRRQTVGINQPSELFKYEIIYLRGYDQYDDETPRAKIIYHSQAEGRPITDECAATTEDSIALRMLDDYNTYPYLKLRVCLDGSVRAYLGTVNVDWDLTRQIEDNAATPDTAWVEIPQINTDQFRHMDLWVRFDSINALSYYLITKYEDNIFDIGPKDIQGGLSDRPPISSYYDVTIADDVKGGSIIVNFKSGTTLQRRTVTLDEEDIIYGEWEDVQVSGSTLGLLIDIPATRSGEQIVSVISLNDAVIKFINGNSSYPYTEDNGDIDYEYNLNGLTVNDITDSTVMSIGGVTFTRGQALDGDGNPIPSAVAGKDYELVDSTAIANPACTPCCKKDNLSRSIWAYINPRTMTPYDDDYWFHQGEPYYKKSLTLSTKQNPLKAQRIIIEKGTFPGMYKIVGETYIRSRDTGEDERVQFTLPLCKIKSDQTLTLQADGDPTTFNLDVEVATPQNGIPMEIIFYEVEKEMKQGCAGNMIEKDGSTRISAK